jgi:hypothetical protein
MIHALFSRKCTKSAGRLHHLPDQTGFFTFAGGRRGLLTQASGIAKDRVFGLTARDPRILGVLQKTAPVFESSGKPV